MHSCIQNLVEHLSIANTTVKEFVKESNDWFLYPSHDIHYVFYYYFFLFLFITNIFESEGFVLTHERRADFVSWAGIPVLLGVRYTSSPHSRRPISIFCRSSDPLQNQRHPRFQLPPPLPFLVFFVDRLTSSSVQV